MLKQRNVKRRKGGAVSMMPANEGDASWLEASTIHKCDYLWRQRQAVVSIEPTFTDTRNQERFPTFF